MTEEYLSSLVAGNCRRCLSVSTASEVSLPGVHAAGRWRKRLARHRLLLSVMFALTLPLAGCATTHGHSGDLSDDTPYDPLESYNRVIFKFNDKFDKYLLKPVAQGYEFILPRPVQNSVSRFFNNLLGPTVVVNDLLQGKLKRTAADTGRFLVNSTVGIAGLFDPAKPMGLPPHDEDFGQTLGVWGVHAGPYIVWPILGPSDLRDSIGLVPDYYTYPVNYVKDSTTRWGVRILGAVNTRANLLGVTNVLEQAAGPDKYLFVREAYFQHRLNLIYDGHPPQPKFLDDDSFDDSTAPGPGDQASPSTPSTPSTPAPTQQSPGTVQH